MPTDVKLQIVFAIVLAFELLGLFMIIVRTVAGMEFAFNRIEAVVHREVQLSIQWKEQQRITEQKNAQGDQGRGKKNELLLNIPFMERLSKEKRKDE